MLSFKEESAIKIYKVHLDDPKKSQEILREILGTEQRERRQETYKDIYTNYGKSFNNFEVNLIDNGIKTVSKYPYHPASYSDWTLGDITTETITYIAPYTLALGAENFALGPYNYSFLMNTPRSKL